MYAKQDDLVFLGVVAVVEGAYLVVWIKEIKLKKLPVFK